jgi:hypothetical protein
VVDPALLGEITEVHRKVRRATFPKPIKIWLTETSWSVVPDVAHWRRFPRADLRGR